jgi:hypothetical protein
MSEPVRVTVDVDPRVGPMKIIPTESIPWVSFIDPTGWIDPGCELKRLTNPECDVRLELLRFPPNFVAPSHWHETDTVYIVMRGVFTVEGEGDYKPGDARWVKAGTAYGRETAGPDGCDVYFITAGAPAIRNPEVDPPPRGYWYEADR